MVYISCSLPCTESMFFGGKLKDVYFCLSFVHAHTHMHTCTHTVTHTHKHAHTHTHSHTHTHTSTHACTHPHTHTSMHARTHPHTQSHTHTCSFTAKLGHVTPNHYLNTNHTHYNRHVGSFGCIVRSNWHTEPTVHS